MKKIIILALIALCSAVGCATTTAQTKEPLASPPPGLSSITIDRVEEKNFDGVTMTPEDFWKIKMPLGRHVLVSKLRSGAIDIEVLDVVPGEENDNYWQGRSEGKVVRASWSYAPPPENTPTPPLKVSFEALEPGTPATEPTPLKETPLPDTITPAPEATEPTPTPAPAEATPYPEDTTVEGYPQ